jgi:L-amino acid N-acyltransferase YncA
MNIRLARLDDAAATAAIYAPIVRDTVISFEVEAPDAAEFERRISGILPKFPWLVAEEAGRVVGYAYAGPHRARAAYRWSVEPSVYVAEKARGRGMAKALYEKLFAILRAQGFANAYAGVALPNEPSIRLHRAFGFKDVGIYERVGFKFGKWHDVWWGALDLAPDRDGTPLPPLSLDDLNLTVFFTAA